jgi:subfamily B ATP-binding cassette protein MsbA
MLGIVIYTDWQLTLILLVVAPLFYWILSWSGKKAKEQQTFIQEDLSNLTHTANEGISGQKIAKAFNLQNYLKDRFNLVQDKFFYSQMQGTKVEELAHPLVEFATAVAFAIVIVFAHFRIKSGAISVGDFITFIASLALLMDPIRKYSQANVKLNQAIAASFRIFKVLLLEEEKDVGAIKNHKFSNQIEIKNLWFSYDKDHVILKNFSMNVKKGEKVAIVGLSGSGKSTLINLLLGLYPIDQGEINIDGIPFSTISLKNIRDIFGLVSQDIFLFHDTIEENMQVGVKYSQSQIDYALKVSYADEYVSKLPLKTKTIIGDRGARLSGGQQQRLTIARAFLKDSDVFLFDEATSALDNESEKVVQKALEQLSEQKTVIAIAHRLSSIQEYDRIYVLKEGELIEQGTHYHLMSINGEYRKLYELSVKV